MVSKSAERSRSTRPVASPLDSENEYIFLLAEKHHYLEKYYLDYGRVYVQKDVCELHSQPILTVVTQSNHFRGHLVEVKAFLMRSVTTASLELIGTIPSAKE